MSASEGPTTGNLSPEERLLREIFGETGSRTRRRKGGRGGGTLTLDLGGEPTVGEVVDLLSDLRAAYFAIVRFLSKTPQLIGATVTETPLVVSDLVLGRVEMRSPGPWDFIGQLNPLKVIADFIQQRHERNKDNEYRNRAEEERLTLENALLRNKVLSERLDILKAAGVPEEDIRGLLLRDVLVPLTRLGAHVDSRLIRGATSSEDKDEAA